MSDLKRRLFFGLLFILCLVLILTWAYHPFWRYVTLASVGLFTLISLWEYQQFAKEKGSRSKMRVLLLLGLFEIVTFFLAALWPAFREAPLYGLFVSLIAFFALHFRHKEGALLDLALSMFGMLYIVVPLGMFLALLYDSNLTHGAGRLWVVYGLIVTKIADIGAYFGGHLCGRHKLAPSISPNKTMEGAIAGLIAAIGSSFAMYALQPLFSASHFDISGGRWLGLGLMLGVMGQFGDLAESLLKRDVNKKDSNALPGIGGALDAVDSLLFTLPLLYFYLRAVSS